MVLGAPPTATAFERADSLHLGTAASDLELPESITTDLWTCGDPELMYRAVFAILDAISMDGKSSQNQVERGLTILENRMSAFERPIEHAEIRLCASAEGDTV